MRSKIGIFLIVTIAQALGQALADIYLPSFPAISTGFNVSIQQVELTLTVFAIGYGVSQLFYGPLSDAFGRKNPLLFGLGCCVIGSFVCALSKTISVFMLGRVFQALGAGATLTIGGAMFRDLFEGPELSKYNSYSGIVFVIFLAMAPLLGGYIQEYIGWRAIFIFMTIFSGMIFSAFIFLPETNQHKTVTNLHFEKLKSNIKTLLSSPIFIGYTVCSLATYGAILAWVTAGPALLETVVGLTPVQYGWIYAVTAAAFAAGAFLNSMIVPRFGINSILQIGLICMLGSGFLMFMLSLMGYINTMAIAGPAFLLSFSASLVFPNTSAGLFQPFPEIAGVASALFYSSRLFGGAIFSAAIVLLPHETQTPMAVMLIVGSLLALLAFALTIKKEAR